MLPSVSAFFERLADRCLALAASLLASSIESACVRREAEQQTQLEELARTYEADGHSDVAASIRERAQQIAHANPAALGESLLNLGRSTEQPEQDSVANTTGPVPLALPSPGRKGPSRGKRATTTGTLTPLGDLLSSQPVVEPAIDNAVPAPEVGQ